MAKTKGTPKTPAKKGKNALADPNERKRFKTGLATITHHLQAIDDQKEAIKETVEELADSVGLDKKTVKKLAVTMYKHNYASLQEENRHFESLYETVVDGKLLTASDPLDSDEEDADKE